MVFWLTFAACSRIFLESSIRPLLISQRGDSGKHLKKKNEGNSQYFETKISMRTRLSDDDDVYLFRIYVMS